jgi:hypothetical protein
MSVGKDHLIVALRAGSTIRFAHEVYIAGSKIATNQSPLRLFLRLPFTAFF